MHEYLLGIQGQESALKLLSQIHSSNRIPHALLFTGPEGVGKFFTAIEFLKLLNENCSSSAIKNIQQLAEPYVKVITPLPRGKSESNNDLPTSKLSQDIVDEYISQLNQKSINPYHKFELKNANNIKINSIREINKVVSLNFDEIPYRGILLLDAHKMSVEAQNAFLKNLEEPPEGIIYILITDNPSSLLTTIKSRCWQIHFNPLKNNVLKNILGERYQVNDDQIDEVINFSNGSVTNALFLIENDIQKLLKKTILILRYSLAKKYYTASKEFMDLVTDNSIITFQLIIDLIITWFVDTEKIKSKPASISFNNYSETLEKFNERFTGANIPEIITKLAEYRNAPTRNVSLNISIMNVIFEIASIGM